MIGIVYRHAGGFIAISSQTLATLVITRRVITGTGAMTSIFLSLALFPVVRVLASNMKWKVSVCSIFPEFILC